ncbi:MAG: GDP-fucose synthetase [Candidatus Methanoperedens nitroreducens]|uniref:GDP-L-fucose synthase n=1 Tax=Candidatus Methanoperedens nitratireducens TaxID=1392998 RepID=A0A0P8C5J3_9EURY|nr:GDP-L-fucose synthase [Candidatus Methanoperedens sp. BLZ2]KAB2946583.1 MAG: GDP-L-fucose synthase [Candidatus Methanoperedens sp.]KPQ41942.1 MAG: GDP-fucose synthetase [Candidatus Methanoperedens sp. BLZ1]MBZ0175088.1 GDP-L-fucose synthase [Candidatus Methanoperedens nitroreducens]
MNRSDKIYIAGHRGMAGSAIKRNLESKGYHNFIIRNHSELDLTNQQAVNNFFEAERPEYVFLAAAKVGGILANSTYPAEFIYENIMIEANVIHAAYTNGVKKLLFLGSSCIYPGLAPQPLKEDYLLKGELEVTNEAYAVAKIAGIRMCKHYNQQYGMNFISVMPTNLYGPNDNYDLTTSHVMAALIRKFHEAKINSAPRIIVWGTGAPRREFLHVDDMADACVYLMENYDAPDIGEFVNIGVGKDLTIRELAELIGDIAGYKGEIVYDITKPDGTPQKLLDVSRLCRLGWKARISLRDGIEQTYEWYVSKSNR